MKLLEHFKELTVHPKNAQELKGLILQLAVQGKLTRKWREENPDVEPASVLLERIKDEKEKLVNEKKIKKEKPLPEIYEEDIPFTLPNSWNCCKLIHLSIINGGFAFKSSAYNETGVRVIRISDFDESGFKNHKIVRHPYSPELELFKLEEGNIIMAMTGGTVGKSLFVKCTDEAMVVNQRVATIKIIEPLFDGYVNCVLQTRLIQSIISEAKNSTNDNISMSDIKEFPIPLPPLKEQKAIVEVVNHLFAEVEQLEELTIERIQLKADFVTSALNRLTQAAIQDAASQWAFLKQQFGTFFTEKESIKKLREGILQLAVRGKLTHRWRSLRQAQGLPMESASELLEKIKAKKEELIKAGKIKKEKPLPEISEKDIPYGLPEGWIWEYLGNSMLKITDGTHHSPTNIENGDFKYVSAKNIKEDGIKLSNITYVTKEVHREIYARCNPEIGDLLYIKDGATTGICCINNLDEKFSMLSSIALLKLPTEILNEYLLRVMRSPYYYDLMREGMSGVAITRVTLTKMKASVIQIPPLEEQKAIVEKVNALMALCDKLEQEIETHQITQEQWMQRCLREVFEG